MRSGKQNGSTLVEVMAGFVIGLMIIAVMGSVLMLSFRVFHRTAAAGENQIVTDTVNHFLKEHLRYASFLEVSNEPLPSVSADHEIRFCEDGTVYFDGEEIFGRELYETKRLVLILSDPSENSILEYTVLLEDTDGEVLSRELSMIRLLNQDEINNRDEVCLSAVREKLMDSREGTIYLYYTLGP